MTAQDPTNQLTDTAKQSGGVTPTADNPRVNPPLPQEEKQEAFVSPAVEPLELKSPAILESNMPPEDILKKASEPKPFTNQDVPPPPPLMTTPPPPVGAFSAAQPGPTVPEQRKSRGVAPKILLFILGIVILVTVVALGIKLAPSLKIGPAGTTTITWWGLWEDSAQVQPLIDEYQSQHPNVKINYVNQAKEDYRERLTNALVQGKGPDIFRFHNSWTPMFRSDLDSVPASVMSPAEYSKTFYPVVISDLTADGGFKGIPLDFDTLALFINQDIFDTYGKTVPTNWDDLRQTAIDLTIKDKDTGIKQAGIAIGRTENVDNWQEILSLMMMENGVKMGRPTGDRAANALDFFTLFSKTDGVWDETLPPSTIAFANGKVAMIIAPSWRIHEIKQINPNLKFKVYEVPQLPKEHPDDPSVAYATYWVEGVSRKSPVKDAAWDFLKFLSTSQSLQKLYTEESKIRLFGELYPRTDMANLLSQDPIVGAFIRQAPFAQSWYLNSRTFDGPTGINSQISKYFEDAINGVNKGSDSKSSMDTVANGVLQVLSQYGLAQAPTPTPK
jgi:multiple sugar transport system substrate-binding protein